MSGKRIIIHSLAHARDALAAAAALKVPVTLASAKGAGGYVGPLWFKSLVETVRAEFPEVEVAAVLDCGSEAGTTMAALRHGLKHVRFTGNETALASLRDIAQGLGAEVETAETPDKLDLLNERDPEAAARDYLRRP